MKKLITICVGLIVAGCDNSGQLAEANAKIQDLEKRLEKIEEKEMLAFQEELRIKRESEAAAKAAEVAKVAEDEKKKVVDAKIDAFLKEYLGVQFGDKIDKFPEGKGSERTMPVLKKFKYFDRAVGEFSGGKLCVVSFEADIDYKYSYDSIIKKMEQVFADLSVSLGFESSAFGHLESNGDGRFLGALRKRQKILDGYSYRLEFIVPDSAFLRSKKDGHMTCRIHFSNRDFISRIAEEARRKANATGETLPDPE